MEIIWKWKMGLASTSKGVPTAVGLASQHSVIRCLYSGEIKFSENTANCKFGVTAD
jgi:hypothetical protein